MKSWTPWKREAFPRSTSSGEAMLVIRRANIKDLAALTELLGVLFSIEEDFEADAGKQGRGLALMLQGDSREVLVAEADGRVVGMVSAQLLISTAEGAPSALLEDLVVREECREKKIGLRLLAGIENWAREQGATRCQLLADRDNAPALTFYEKNGWGATNLICLRKKWGKAWTEISG